MVAAICALPATIGSRRVDGRARSAERPIAARRCIGVRVAACMTTESLVVHHITNALASADEIAEDEARAAEAAAVTEAA